MSSGNQLIACRRCDEPIQQNEGSCPHCGTTVRGTGPYLAGAAGGLVLFAASLLDFGTLYLFGILGLLLAVVCGYLLYEKRQRVGSIDAAT